MVWESIVTASPLTLSALVLALGVALGFECVNGFHDTANAVVGVIYTRAMQPTTAVVFSGVMNFLGVSFGGIAVAYSIVHLLPVDLLVDSNQHVAFAMIGALLVAATIWNLGTWWLGLPASSSHALIGAIIGVGIANAVLTGQSLASGVAWPKAGEVIASLVVSPLIGFGAAAVALVLIRRIFPPTQFSHFYRPPQDGKPPKRYVREALVMCCAAISFAHGSNDGQKGMGLIMLILIGLFPATFALNAQMGARELNDLNGAAKFFDRYLADRQAAWRAVLAADHPLVIGDRVKAFPVTCGLSGAQRAARDIAQAAEGHLTVGTISPDGRWRLRTDILCLDNALNQIAEALPPPEGAVTQAFQSWRRALRAPTEYVPDWVKAAVALALGLGTMIGWRRVVVTVGEKIGHQPMTYAQGTAAQAVTAATIGLADMTGMPVSTTHVLSSAVTGTMAADRHRLDPRTLKSIGLAWVMTLPATMLLGGCLFLVAASLLR